MGYSKFTISRSIKCLKHVGVKPLGQASTICGDQHGGYLPLPLNEKENNDYFTAFLTFNLTSGSSQGNGVALDLTDVASEGTFVRLSNGQAPTYTFWDILSGEPNNFMGGEHYVVMFTSVPFWAPNAFKTWNDFEGTKQFEVICETDKV